ncbi:MULTISPECIES: helix-turn-helix domain-containing protein [Saccharopolyspora]|uniref:helix-turn-helix domain-containing protein n=1 Tax=Saccharopolyspora TaxID=1835 RepID=UPI001CD6CB6B|nr:MULTISPECIES: helix-turn-helix domain-containing protein [Saccharopolyspora]MCA1196279.1 GAF domain-containing protein [Saccharopolyspora sp. 6V]MCA1281563.1 GAF domain-containing protein [Saccharopolyspora sp. 7B]
MDDARSVRERARTLAQVHDALFSGGRAPAQPRALVARSWRRARAQGVDPDLLFPPDPADAAEVQRRRERSGLRPVLPELRAALTAVAEDSRHVMVVTDADGVVLWREGANLVRHRADRIGFAEGARWSEDVVGGNAIGTALAEGAAVQMFAAEHFLRAHHVWTCTAAPLHDPRTGDLLGIVDVSGPVETVHPLTVALVGTAVKVAEAGLRREHARGLDSLRQVAGPLLAGLRGPGLVVDEHGWVAAATGMAGPDRVGAPRSGVPVAVHGVGHCLPEPVPGGWLLRPEPAPRMRLALDLGSSPPRAVVEGTGSWVHPLPVRHAELLVLLAHAGPAGLSAAQLSEALYGDRTHLVTVRAEVSRLRKSLGGLVLARPYRIAPGVEVAPPDRTGPLLSRSTAPGVRRLAR